MHERRIEMRWSDLDAYAHVYHVLDLRGRIWDYVVARVTIDYRLFRAGRRRWDRRQATALP